MCTGWLGSFSSFCRILRMWVSTSARMRIAFVAEYLAQYLRARNDSSCILHEQFEHLEFVRRESNGLIVERRFHPGEVNPNLPEFRSGGDVRSSCMPDFGSHPSQPLSRADEVRFIILPPHLPH